MEYNPEMNSAPAARRPALTGALLFAAMAAGMFVRDLFNSLRNLSMGLGGAGFIYLLSYLTAPILLFVAALLLALYLAGPYRRGARPVLVGIAWFFVVLATVCSLIGSIAGTPIRYLFRNGRWIIPLSMLLVGVLALLAGILTMVGRGWKSVAILAAIFGLLSRVATFVWTILMNRNNPAAYIVDYFLTALPYVLFYLAMLFFAIRYRGGRQ